MIAEGKKGNFPIFRPYPQIPVLVKRTTLPQTLTLINDIEDTESPIH